MRSAGPKLFLIVLAALILVLGFVAFQVLRGDEEGAETLAVEEANTGEELLDDLESDARSTGEPKASETQRSERKDRRRLRNAQQRQKLIAAIELARSARLQGRLPADGRSSSTEDVGEGELSKESIQDAVHAVIEDVKVCYEDQLKLSPELGGKIIVDFTINAEEGVGGVVDSVTIGDESDESMRQAAELSECIVDTIYTLELPEPKGGGTVDVSYPLVMKPGPSR